MQKEDEPIKNDSKKEKEKEKIKEKDERSE